MFRFHRAVHRMAPVAAALCAAPPAWAHDDVPQPVHDAGVVVITGAQPSSLPTRIPTTIEGVTAEQVDASINATDSEDALKYLPSLLVRKRYAGDYNHAVLSTRASGTGNSARSMVYADGILLSNLLGNGASFTPRWGLVTPEEIARVDVLYGPFSAAYPGNSVGAVVDYVTRMPTRFEAHAKVGVFTQPFDLYGTHDRYSGAQASTSLGSREGALAWWINLSRLDSEGQPLVFATRTPSAAPPGNETPVTGAVPGKNRSDADWLLLGTSAEMHTVQDHLKAKLAYDFSDTLRASALFGLWRNGAQGRAASYLRDAAGHAVDNASGGGITQPVAIEGHPYTLTAADFPRTDEDLEHHMLALSLKRHGHGLLDWELAASRYDYARDLLRAYAPSDASQPRAGRLTEQHGTGWHTLALKATWRPQGEEGAHVVDGGLQEDGFQLRQRVFATDDWLSAAAGAQTARFQGRTRLRSAYAQDAWAFAPRWKTVLGLRAEQWDAWDARTANASSAYAHPERREHHVSPKAALAFELSPQWVLKASSGRAWRMPTVAELYQGGLNSLGQLQNGNPDLKPEASWTHEFSAEGDLGPHHLRATLFQEDTRDALYSQTNTTVTPNVTNIQNVDRIRTRGVELAGSTADLPVRGLELSGSVTYADSRILRNDKFPASVGHWQPRVPRWRSTLVATWRADERWTATLGARYSGRQYSTLDGSDPNGSAYMGASKYFTADLRLRCKLDRQWTAAFGIDNLNNDRYWNFHPYPQRTYSAELKYDL